MKTLAAILVQTGKELIVDEIEIPPLKPGQVLVELSFSGVCHTQLLETEGHKGEDKFLPHLLGHEGTGFVRDTGQGISKVSVGDRVLLSWIKGPGADVPGSVYSWNGKKVNAGAVTSFNRFAVISENRLTKLPESIPLKEGALLGCAVPTGFGAVINTANARAGESIVIFGVGGVGLCALLGAVTSGLSPIIAVDINETKLDLAKTLGATYAINAVKEDALQKLCQLLPLGADIAIEATGRPQVMAQALQALRPQGGRAVVVGNAHFSEKLEIDPRQLNMGKQLLGTWGGDNNPVKDFPRYFRMLEAKRFRLDPLISKVYSLAQINLALKDLKDGKSIRPLIDLAQDKI